MNPPVDARSMRRLQNLARIALAWGACIAFRLIYLQIYSHEELRQIARAQQERVVETAAPRGSIFDRNGRRLAMSLPVESVVINPIRVPNLEVAADILSAILSIDTKDLLLKMTEAKDAKRGFLWVKRRISFDESQRLHRLKLDWIEFRSETHRYYPKGTLAAQVLGGVDHEERGNGGLELGLQDDLEGIPGTVRLLKDVKDRGFDSRVETSPQPGKDITLTIDERIQFVAEKSLKEAVEGEHCKTGSVVVMNPNTGDIYAMAAYPTFDPNEPPGKDLSSRLNIAVSAPFEPGSVFKIFTLSTALETTRIRPDTLINCGGGIFNLFGRVIHEAKGGFSALTMAEVLARSSNIGAIQIGLQIGDARFLEYIRRFGFGKQTGLPFLSESRGMVRDLRKWQKTSIGSVAMGHEISTTTVQLAQALSAVANGGLLVHPRVVLKRHRDGEPVELEKTPDPVRVLKPETSVTMRQMLEGVMFPPGTGTRARLVGYTCGGKTGSAQIFDFATHQYTHKYNASFAGLAPLNNPAVVVIVTLNGSAKFGGVAAAPVFKEVATAALRFLDVPKDLPDKETPAKEAPTTNDLSIAGLGDEPDDPEIGEKAEEQAGPVVTGPRVPDFHGMTLRKVLDLSSATGMPVDLQGQGIVRGQKPAAGAALAPGERVRVLLGR